MSLADELEPDKGYHKNRIDTALGKLSETDREAWLSALDSGDYTHGYLAALLAKHSGVQVARQTVSDYKRKKSGWV